MPTSVTWNGTSYDIPDAGELNWADLSDFLVALGNNAQTTGAQVWTVRTDATAAATIGATDMVVLMSNTAVKTIELPAASAGRLAVAVDSGGNAGTNNMTINTPGAETISGQASLAIDDDYGGAILISDGTNWFIAAKFSLNVGPNFGSQDITTTGVANIGPAPTTSGGGNLFVDSTSSVPMTITRSGGATTSTALRWYDGTNHWNMGTEGGEFHLKYDSSDFTSATNLTVDTSGNFDFQAGDLTTTGDVGIGASVTANRKAYIVKEASQTVGLEIRRPASDANTTSPHLVLQSQTSGSTDGDSFLVCGTQSTNWAIGVDQGDSNKFKIENSNSLSTSADLTITTGGFVGINQTAPNSPLEVYGNQGSNYVARFVQDSASGYGVLIDTDSVSSGDPAFAIQTPTETLVNVDSSGIIQMGTTASADSQVRFGSGVNCAIFRNNSLDSEETMRVVRATTENGNETYIEFYESGTSASSTGTLAGGIRRNSGDTAYEFFSSSDERLKENIRDWDVNATSKLMSLQVREFNWKGQDKDCLGFVAQEVREHIPDAVTEGKNGYLMLGMSGMHPYYVKAFQEMQGEIDALKSELASLRN